MNDTTLNQQAGYTLAERKDTYLRLLNSQKLTQLSRTIGVKNIHNYKNGIPDEWMLVALKILDGLEVVEADITAAKELARLYKKARFALKPAVSKKPIKSELPEPAEASGNAEIFDPEITYLPNILEPRNMQLTVLSRAMEDILIGTYKIPVGNARGLYGVNSEAYKKLKDGLPAFAFAGTFKTKVANAEFDKSSDIIAVDIDKLGDNLVPVDEKLRGLICCLFLFLSPSGDGLKAGFRLKPGTIKNDADFKKVFAAIQAFLKSAGVEITVDKACKNVGRLCFVSYDPERYFNPEAKCFDWEAWINKPEPPIITPEQVSTTSNTSPLSPSTQSLMGNSKQDCTGKLENMLRGAKEGERHYKRLAAGKFAGGCVAGGILEETEALDVLRTASDAISDNGVTDDKEWQTILDAFELGRREPITKLEPGVKLAGSSPFTGGGDNSNSNGPIEVFRGDVRDGTSSTRALTELGNRNRMLDSHIGNIHYCHELKSWLIWKDGAWNWDIDGARIRNLIARLPKQIYNEGRAFLGDASVKPELFPAWARTSQKENTIRAVYSLLSDVEETRLLINLVDSHPLKIGFDNAKQIIDLETGTIRAARQEDYITKSLGVSKLGQASHAVRWLKFLDEIFNNDAELIDWLKRWCGYLLTGSSVEHFLLFLFGFGRNGKSVFAEALKHTMGDYARVIKPETLAESKKKGADASPDIAELPGVRMVLSSETQENTALDETLIKGLVAADSTAARKLYGSQFEFIPQFKLMMLGNHQPVIRGTDLGIWSRIRLVPFTRQFTGKDCDKSLGETLKLEAPHILAWMIEGCLAWQKQGLSDVPVSVAASTKAYKSDQDIIGKWLNEYCGRRPGHEVLSSTLYGSYKIWCEHNGHRPVSNSVLGRKLSERGFKVRESNGKNYRADIAVLLPESMAS